MSDAVRAMTRQQRYMTLALRHVHEVEPKDKALRDIYGSLCHSFPVLVRTCGLCQALAFIEAKAKSGTGERREAYRLLHSHIADLLSTIEDRSDAKEDALSVVRQARMVDYMRYTRTILSAWIFYKRFAVSILKVNTAQAAQDDGVAQ